MQTSPQMLKEVTDVLTICGNKAKFKDHERYKALCAGAAMAAQATPPKEGLVVPNHAFIDPSHPTASTGPSVSNLFEAEEICDDFGGDRCYCKGGIYVSGKCVPHNHDTTKQNTEGLGPTTTLHTTTEILPYVSTPLPGNTCEYCAYCPGKSKEKERHTLPFEIGCSYCFCRKCSCHHIN